MAMATWVGRRETVTEAVAGGVLAHDADGGDLGHRVALHQDVKCVGTGVAFRDYVLAICKFLMLQNCSQESEARSRLWKRGALLSSSTASYHLQSCGDPRWTRMPRPGREA